MVESSVGYYILKYSGGFNVKNNRIVKYGVIALCCIIAVSLIHFWWIDFIGTDYKSKTELKSVWRITVMKQAEVRQEESI